MDNNSLWRPCDDIEDGIFDIHSDCILSISDYGKIDEVDSFNNHIDTIDNYTSTQKHAPLSSAARAIKTATILSEISSTTPKMGELLTTTDLIASTRTYEDKIQSGIEITDMIRKFGISNTTMNFKKPTTLQKLLDSKRMVHEKDRVILLHSDYFKYKKKDLKEDNKTSESDDSSEDSTITNISLCNNSSVEINYSLENKSNSSKTDHSQTYLINQLESLDSQDETFLLSEPKIMLGHEELKTPREVYFARKLKERQTLENLNHPISNANFNGISRKCE